MKCSQINRYNEIQIIREMRSPWQLIMWKRKQFNKGQTRFENRLGGVVKREADERRAGGGWGGGQEIQREGKRVGEREWTFVAAAWQVLVHVSLVWRICVYPKDAQIIRKVCRAESADSGFNTQKNYFRGSQSENHLLVTFLRGPLVQGKMEAAWQAGLSYGIFVFL